MSDLQATVATYDDSTRSGTVLLDDGVVLPFPGDALRSDVRHLRPGQRVHLEVDRAGGDHAIVGVSIH